MVLYLSGMYEVIILVEQSVPLNKLPIIPFIHAAVFFVLRINVENLFPKCLYVAYASHVIS